MDAGTSHDSESHSSEFAAATMVTPIAEGRYAAEVHPGWDIGGNANGGYVLAIAARAMADVVGRPPLSITAHYLAPVPAGHCEVAVTPIRVGRRMATVSATLTIGATSALTALGTFAEQVPGGPELIAAEPVDVPAYADCLPVPEPTEGFVPALMGKLASRLRPGDAGFRHGAKTGVPELRGWFALPDTDVIDPIALLLAADSFAPPVFQTELPVAWVPTLELTVHLRAIPAPGPIRCRFRTRYIQDGLIDEDGEMWDSTGRLVAMSRQLALAPRA